MNYLMHKAIRWNIVGTRQRLKTTQMSKNKNHDTYKQWVQWSYKKSLGRALHIVMKLSPEYMVSKKKVRIWTVKKK